MASDFLQKCGNCRWWKKWRREARQMVHYGDCTASIPDSMPDGLKVAMPEGDGQRCPCWQPKSETESEGK